MLGLTPCVKGVKFSHYFYLSTQLINKNNERIWGVFSWLFKNPRSLDKFFLDFLLKVKKELVQPSAPFIPLRQGYEGQVSGAT